MLILSAIPAIAGYIGTTQIGWSFGAGPVHKLTTQSAMQIAVLTYLVMLVAVFSLGKAIHWMGQTYGSKQTLPASIALAAYAALMLAFGLGTLPMLLAVGAAAEWLKDFVRRPWVRRGAGLMVLLFGLYTILAPGGHEGHARISGPDPEHRAALRDIPGPMSRIGLSSDGELKHGQMRAGL